MTAVRILIWLISTAGLWEIVRRSFPKADVSFIPGMTAALQTTVLFLAGLLNLLPETVFLLTLAGAAGLAFFTARSKGFSFLKAYLHPAYAVLGVTMLAMGIFLKGRIFVRFDNFSHWALAVRCMLENNRLPSFADPVITFQSYPAGSALWIYQFCRIAGNSESLQMFAQVWLISANALPLLSQCSKGKLSASLLLGVLINWLLLYNIEATDLSVDTLLPVVSMGGLLFMAAYCRKNCETRMYLPAACWMIQMTQIKNSGLFFAAAACILLLRRLPGTRRKTPLICCAAAPFVSFFLWQKHCRYAFPDSALSKHAMTAENFAAVFRTKTTESAAGILGSLLRFLAGWKDGWMTLGLLLAILLLSRFFLREERKSIRNSTLLAGGMLLVYQAGIYGMYLFSMPGREAVTLAGLERYEKTVIIAVLYLMMIPVMKMIPERLANGRFRSVLPAVVVSALMLVYMGITQGRIAFAFQGPFSGKEDPEWRIQLERMKAEYRIPEGKSYTVLIPKTADRNYTYYLCKYIFQSGEIDPLYAETYEELNGISSEYILVCHRNDVISKWTDFYYPEQAEASVILTE